MLSCSHTNCSSLILRGGPAVRFKKLPLVAMFILASIAAVYGQDKSTGTIKGKVKVEVGTPGGVSVIVREGEREIRQVSTNKNGEFIVARLAPGRYGLTFRKPGLSVGAIENVEVKAGK